MASVTYSKPVISGYDASPPSDDGSQTSQNEVKWSTHKDKLADPIKTYTDAINDAIETTVNAMGTVADQNIGKTASTVNQGGLVQRVITTYATSATHSTTLPMDDTIPQNTEGDEIMTRAITPNATDNRLLITVVIFGSPSSTVSWGAALFQDSTAGALAGATTFHGSDTPGTLTFVHEMAAGTVSETTFKVRVGTDSGTSFYSNGNSTRRFGGVAKCSLLVEEYAD